MGRRSKEGLVLQRLPDIEAFSKLGNTDGEIAQFLGVSGGTFSEYKRKYPKINDALNRGRGIFGAEEDKGDALLFIAEATQSSNIETTMASTDTNSDEVEELERLLTATARGGRYQEIVRIPIMKNGKQVLDKDGNPITQISKVVEKFVPPNFHAIKYSLEKLHAKKWNSKEFNQLNIVGEGARDGDFEI
jgi:hypothetical protein